MLLRQALQIAGSSRLSTNKKIALVCSFEPLHLKTYLQAFLAQRFPDDTPELITFGYDLIQDSLMQTSSELRSVPALVCLSWEDIHPGLTWRTRGKFGDISAELVREQGGKVKDRLLTWIGARKGDSYLVVPPIEWLPFHESVSPLGIGSTSTATVALMWEIAHELTIAGMRLLRPERIDLNYRDLLQAGHPFSLEGCEILARQFVDFAFPSIERKKVLVTDLDGTLWKGVIGEDGINALQCRSTGAGYPFYVFQKYLKKLKSEGILLSFCSKNNLDDVLPAFNSLQMPLEMRDFANFRCNWESKSNNLRSIAQELNVGVDAVVFIDDNEAELAEVGQNLPEVLVFRTPREGGEWMNLFSRFQTIFGTWRISEEDRLRTTSFSKPRQVLMKSTIDLAEVNSADYLADLQLSIVINESAFLDPRSLELINKTNQFNLTGQRLTQQDWLAWASTPGAFCISAKLRDRFGDFGTICVITGINNNDQSVSIKQFVLSCRAFGRFVEHVVLREATKHAASEWIMGAFKQNEKNEPARRFLQKLGCNTPVESSWRMSQKALSKVVEQFLAQSKAEILMEEKMLAS